MENETAQKILERGLRTVQNQKSEKMYDLVWVGKGYSKKHLIEDLKRAKEKLDAPIV